MIYLLAGLVLLVLAWAVWRFAMSAPPRRVARVLLWLLLAVLATMAAGLALAGQPRLAMWPALAIVPLTLALLRVGRGRGGPPVSAAPGDADMNSMTAQQAAEILGVPVDAGREEIIAAHARQRALRDADGASRWATARLDRARDVLLGQHD